MDNARTTTRTEEDQVSESTRRGLHGQGTRSDLTQARFGIHEPSLAKQQLRGPAEYLAVGRHVADGNQRGTVQAEYVTLLVLVSLGMTVALGVVGRLLVTYHDVIDEYCGLPFP